MKPLVSIIIPTYNHAIYLKKALKSIIDQSYNNWEAIIIDNHSDDNTDLLLHSINDKRIKIYKIHNNGIIAASRNLGIKHSTGSFLAFLDSDDWWYDKKLEKCINQINNGSNYICHAEHWVKNRKIIRTVTYGPTGKANYYNLLYGKNCISTSAIIIRKDYVINVGGFIENPSARGVEDYHLWLKLAKHGYQPEFINQVLGCYRIYDFNYRR